MDQIQGFFFKNFSQSYIPEILKELYRDRVYDSYFNGKKDLVVLDIGANIGLFTYYAFPFAKKIISVEPSAYHFESLLALVNFNHMLDKVTPVQKAVSNANEKQTFFHNSNATMFSLNKAVNNLPEDAEEVLCTTLDQLLKDNNLDHVDFMKIDIEGAEGEVFGGEGFAKAAPKIDTIMGEYHTWSTVSPDQLAASIRDRGFTFEWVDKTEATLFKAERIR